MEINKTQKHTSCLDFFFHKTEGGSQKRVVGYFFSI